MEATFSAEVWDHWSIAARYAVATRADFFVRGVVRASGMRKSGRVSTALHVNNIERGRCDPVPHLVYPDI